MRMGMLTEALKTVRSKFHIEPTYAAFTVNAVSNSEGTLPLNFNHTVTLNFRATEYIHPHSPKCRVPKSSENALLEFHTLNDNHISTSITLEQ